jgi:hypothetical protein
MVTQRQFALLLNQAENVLDSFTVAEGVQSRFDEIDEEKNRQVGTINSLVEETPRIRARAMRCARRFENYPAYASYAQQMRELVLAQPQYDYLTHTLFVRQKCVKEKASLLMTPGAVMGATTKVSVILSLIGVVRCRFRVHHTEIASTT